MQCLSKPSRNNSENSGLLDGFLNIGGGVEHFDRAHESPQAVNTYGLPPGSELFPRRGDPVGRVGFLLKVKPERLEEYKERHRTVWPEMLEALRETGWHNYSLFLRPDGLLFGYVEVDVIVLGRRLDG